VAAAAAAASHVPKSQRPCRNIAQFGYCRFAGKGCEFNHDLVCFFTYFLRRKLSFEMLLRFISRGGNSLLK
jgi:hypothetical protein